MKKRHLVLAGLPLLLAALIVVGPHLLDWSRFVPRIAATVRDATGWELRIDGPIAVRLAPAIEFEAGTVRLVNPEGFDGPDFARVQSLRGRLDLLEALRGRVEVEELVIEGLALELEVNDQGAANWQLRRSTSERRALPVEHLAFDEVRVVEGSLTFHHAITGQRLVGRALEARASLTALDHPLALQGSLDLNDKPVTFGGRVEPFRALLERGPADLQAQIESTDIAVQFRSALQIEPLLGLDGAGAVDIPSVGALAEWLDVPLVSNPGPLRVRTRFRSDGPRVALEEATIEGDFVSARASASIELADGAIRITGDIESERLDLDRYLPAPDPDRPAPERPTAGASLRDIYLAAVPDTPLDLGRLRGVVADVRIDVEGIRFRGFEAAPIRAWLRAGDGVLEAGLEEIGLYKGRVAGSARMDATSDVLTASAELEIDTLDAGALAGVAYPDAPPVTGVAHSRIVARTQGRSARALAAGVTGLLTVRLASDGRIEAMNQLSELSLTLERPGVDARVRISGDAVYNGEALRYDATVDPLDTLLAGEPVTVDASIESDFVTARYDGTVYQAPVRSLSGTLDARTASARDLARWLGRTWPGATTAAGPMSLRATLESDGRRGRIEEARLIGDGLDVRASGTFAGDDEQVGFDLTLRGGMLELDRYLPIGRAAGGAPPRGLPARVDALPEDVLDLSFLRRYEGEITLTVEGLRSAAFETGALDLSATVIKGMVDLSLGRLELAGTALTGSVRLDATGEDPRATANVRVVELPAGRLAAAIADVATLADGDVSAAVEISGSGRSLRRLASAATARLTVLHPGMSFTGGPFTRLRELDATVDLPGIAARPRVRLRGTLEARHDGRTFPLDLQGQIGTIDELFGEGPLTLDAEARIGATKLAASGRIAAPGKTSGTELEVLFESPSLAELWLDPGPASVEVGPISVAGTVRTEAGVLAIDDLAARAGTSDLSGSVKAATGGERPRVTARLRSARLDLHALMPFDAVAAATEQKAPGADRVFTDEPLPLEALQVADGEAAVEIAQLILPIGTEIDEVDVLIALDAGRLEADPVTGSYAGGRTELRLVVDASAEPARYELRADERQMLLGTFVPIVKSDGDTEGRADIEIELAASGASPRAIAASLDGDVRVIGAGGAIDSRLVGALALDVFDILSPFISRDGNTSLNCFVAGFGFEDGVGTARTMLVDFPSLSIVGSGGVDLSDESLDLRFATNSKRPSLATFAVPIYVTGTLASPRVRAGTVGAVVRGMATWFNPLAAFGTLATIGAGRTLGENPCVVAVRNAEAATESGEDGRTGDKGKSPFRPLRRLFGGV